LAEEVQELVITEVIQETIQYLAQSPQPAAAAAVAAARHLLMD
jgi:hypothetical protein